MIRPIYLDYNATTPHDPAVIEAIRPFLEEHFGNPSSSHWYGIRPRQAVEEARRRTAALLGCSPAEVFFTSGGTESNNHAIAAVAGAGSPTGKHIVTTSVEHPAVLEVCRYLESQGAAATYLPVDGAGRVNVEKVQAAIRPETVLITIMHANNEVGTVQPIAEIAELARSRNILFHTDAAQSIGKIPADVESLGVDMLSIAGHKLYAPKGVGALYVRSGIDPAPFCRGAGQESGRRAGTENVMGIVGLGKACEIAGGEMTAGASRMAAMRAKLEDGLRTQIGDIRVNGHPDHRLPNTLSVSFYGVDADRLLEEIGLEVSASAGAACHSDRVEPSHVLVAMNVPEEWARGTVRFSTGRFTTEEEIDRTLEAVSAAVARLQENGR